MDAPWHKLYSSGVPNEDAEPVTRIVERFRSHVRAAADAPALHYFGTTLSRREVDLLSDAVGWTFYAEGVRAGDRVALSLQNTPMFVLATLAGWKLGAILVLVNPMYRARELAHVLRDSGARLLIADPALADTIVALPPDAQPSNVLFSGASDIATDMRGPWPTPEPYAAPRLLDTISEHAEAGPPPRPKQPTPIALLTYTSGTTGPAKGAMNTHANVAHEVETWQHWLALDRDDVMISLAPLFHITGFVVHLSVALGAGVPLVLTHRFAAGPIAALVERYRPTVTIASITAFLALLGEPETQNRDLTSLQKVFSGGAPVSAAAVERFEQAFGTYIHNAYGLTETTSGTIAVPLGRRAPVDPASGALSIGVPLPGVSISVLNDDGSDLPVGQVGELVMRGPQVAIGYWQNPEETSRAFTDRGLLTGDVGFIDEDGWVYLVDRKKDLIIVSGYKVWPREVEDVLHEHHAVHEAAVVGAAHPYRGETVHAFVSLRGEGDVTAAKLQEFCRVRLSAYKCPTQIEVLAELPKTPTGKILRRRLRAEKVRPDYGEIK